LGFKSNEIIERSKIKSFDEAGLGRIVRLEEEISLSSLVDKVKNVLNIDTLRIVKGNDKVKTIAIINGSGQDFISEAVKLGADCIITGDTTYHFASDYKELGVSIIDAGHFNTEWLVFLRVLDDIRNKFKDIEFIESKEAKDPYTFI
ncbi:MAG: Nif3-like dinuclear metal center hexameric protein, partial [Clostridium baratii]|nr:Nif3-like dinuclear metal center hexameric protein [Clostridium baratii]